MKIKPIKSEHDYQSAIERLEVIFDAKPGTPEGDELEVLGVLIDNYERTHFPIDLPDHIEAIKFRMEQMDSSNKDLAAVIGFKGSGSEILKRMRKLSFNMIIGKR